MFQFMIDNPTSLFRPASCEFAGHILIHDTEVFETITEDDVVKVLKSRALDSDVFSDLVLGVKNRLQ